MYSSNFYVEDQGHWIRILVLTNLPFTHFIFHVDHYQVGTFSYGREFYLEKSRFPWGSHILSIRASYLRADRVEMLHEEYLLYTGVHRLATTGTLRGNEWDREEREPSVGYRAGDILVASDNVDENASGYIGHSAIVVGPNELVESIPSHPIRRASIAQYVNAHPIHSHYRPKDAQMGQKAAEWALGYEEQYRKNLQEGKQQPQFSFYAQAELDDPWTYVYCSKLVWLAYHYGAEYTFENDHLWFAPEDIPDILSEDDNFELLYKHPNFKFLIDV